MLARTLRVQRAWRVLLAFCLTLAIGSPLAPGAAAFEAVDTLVYKGSNSDTKVIVDTGVLYADGCVIGDDPVTCFPDVIPGTVWYRVQLGIKYQVLTAQSANFKLNGPDNFRQDTTASFNTTLTTVDVNGKEVTLKASPFIEVDVAYDAPVANCAKNTITTVQELMNADTSGCLNAVAHTRQVDLATVTLLSQDTTLPYSGTRALNQTAEGPEFDIGALIGVPGVLKVRPDFTTTLELTAGGGFTATRTIAGSSNPGTPLVSGPISWPDGNPQADDVQIPCSVSAGDNLIYKLTNNKWSGTAKASETLSLAFLIVDPIPDFSIDVLTVTLFNGLEVVSNANDYSRTLGEVLAENKAPTVALAPIPTNGKEGSPIAFAVVGTGPGGSFDNCDASGASLSFHWLFDDNGSAFGKAVSHTYADNNGAAAHSGHVVVADKAGNATDRDFSVAVANVAPVVGAGPARSSYWGQAVAFHANGTDAGAIDSQTLQYIWDFQDPASPIGAAGQDTSHTFALPGTYNVAVAVADKDGGTGAGAVQVTVNKRASTVTYTGPTLDGPNSKVMLTAQVTDNLGQAVVGRVVTFQLGTQTATGTTDGNGVASATLRLSQKPGTYAMSATFAGDGFYTGTAANTSFTIGNGK